MLVSLTYLRRRCNGGNQKQGRCLRDHRGACIPGGRVHCQRPEGLQSRWTSRGVRRRPLPRLGEIVGIGRDGMGAVRERGRNGTRIQRLSLRRGVVGGPVGGPSSVGWERRKGGGVAISWSASVGGVSPCRRLSQPCSGRRDAPISGGHKKSIEPTTVLERRALIPQPVGHQSARARLPWPADANHTDRIWCI